MKQEHEMTPGVLVSANKSPAPDIELVAWMWEWRGDRLITTDYRAALELSEPPEPVKVEALVRMSDCMEAIKAAAKAAYEAGRRDASAAPDAQFRDATGRTADGYAIEHAEYMAKSAERLIAAIDDMRQAEADAIDTTEIVATAEQVIAADEKAYAAHEAVTEGISTLQSRIYQFRKRADRATADTPAPAAPDAPDVAGLIGKMRMFVAAGNRLNERAEECTYDDGMAEVAGADYWYEFRDALEAATDALAAHQKREG